MNKKKAATLVSVISFFFQMLVGVQVPAYAVSAPQLTAEATATQVSLSWDDVGADAYQVWRKDDNSQTPSFVIKETTGQGITAYLDSTVAANNKYEYKIIAVTAAVYSSPSNIETVYTDVEDPSSPTNLRAVPSFNSVTLNWNASTDNWGIQKYNIYYRPENQAGGFNLLNSSTGTTYTHSHLTSNTAYIYYITAVDRAGRESADSSQVNATTLVDTERPGNVTGLTATTVNDTTIDLAWTAATDNSGAVSYVVYRSAANTDANYTQVNTSSTRYSFSSLTSGARYYFKVWAKDDSGNLSATPATTSALAQNDTTKPTPPSIWAEAISSTQVRLTWSGATDNKAVTGYDIYRALNTSSNYTKIASDNTARYTDSTVESNKTYKYYMVAKDAAGNLSVSSNVVTVATNGDGQEPSEPQNLKASLVNNTEVKLTWDRSTDNKSVTGYKIYRALDNGSFSWISSPTTNSYNNTGLTASKNYRYQVTAYDAAGNESSASDTVSIYTSTSARTDTETIDPADGGTLEIAGLVQLEVPEDALSKSADYKLTTKSFSSYSTSGYKTFGQPVEITCKQGTRDITSFDEDLTLTFDYTSSELGSLSTSKLSLYYWDDDNDVWVAVSSDVKSSSKEVVADIDHLTVFALLGDSTAPSTPTLNNSSLSTTQSVTLTGKAEKNASVEILFNGSNSEVKADAKGTFTKQVNLINGSNEIKLRASDAVDNQSSWSQTYTISYSAQYDLIDIRGHWAESNIRKAVQKGITSGYDDKTFRPNRTVTRAEFCKFVVSALNYTAVSSPQFNFKDKSSIPTWAKGFVARAVEKKLISGYDDGTFKANQQITRQEMASILVRAMNLQSEADAQKNSHISFDDAEWIPRWARGAVVVAVDQGIINGYSDNTFGPGKSATRAEAVTMIIKMLDRI